MHNINKVKSEEVDLLIVEDDTLLLRTFTRILRAQFARVFSCERTDQGLTIIENELVPHSLVISDHHNDLSPYHGATMAALSESVRKTKQIPFYLMSGGLYAPNAAEELMAIRSMMKEKTINGFLQKPVETTELDQVLATHYQVKS